METDKVQRVCFFIQEIGCHGLCGIRKEKTEVRRYAGVTGKNKACSHSGSGCMLFFDTSTVRVSGAGVRSGSMLGDASGRRPPARGTEGVDGWVWILVPDVPGLQCRTDAPVTHTSPQCGDPEIIRTGTVRLLRTVPDTRC